MPNNGDVSGYTGVFRLASPSDPHRRVIKRNRQVVSCIPCRNRKLKCDRQQPCASCVRRHDQGACRFFAGTGRAGSGDDGGGAAASPGGGGGGGHHLRAAGDGGGDEKRREFRSRLRILEDMISGLVSTEREAEAGAPPSGGRPSGRGDAARSTTEYPAAAHGGSAHSTSQASAGGGHLSREGNEVRFVGATNYAAVLESIRDLQGFVDADMTDAPPVRARSPSPRQQRIANQSYEFESPVAARDVMEHLPPKAECDGLLTFYFQQIHLIPVLVHSGQFQRAYEKFWEDPENTSLLWMSILFALLSTSVFLQASKALGTGDGSSTLAPERKDRIIDFSAMAYRCLLAGDYLQNKAYCVEATLLFGMHLVLQKRDAEPLCWHTIGTAVRLAQRMGYHRDASNLSRGGGYGSAISPFEAEMRRRTWHTLEYFDVVYSFQLGVPPIIQGDDVDTQLPSNLRDDEFNEDTAVLPQARPTQDFTPILGFTYYSRQVKLLRRVVQQALAVVPPSYGDVRRLDAELRALREDVPPSLRHRPIRESGFADVPDVIMRRLTCEIMYLKCMCVLHRRYLTLERNDGMYEASREACREASLRLLDVQAEFDENSGEGGRLFEKRYYLTNTGYHDFLVASMCICLDLIAGSLNSASSSRPDHERKIDALKKARAIWSKSAHRFQEAAHATHVLDQILSQVAQQQQQDGAAAVASDGARFAASVAQPLNQGGTTGTTPPLPTWPALNNPAKEKSRSHSMKWNYAWLDDVGKPKDAGAEASLEGIFNSADWNRIDSFLLDRGHTTWASAPPPPRSGDPSDSRASREGWPWPSHYDKGDAAARESEVREPERLESGSTMNYRSWNSAGITLAGFGPSSASFTFI